MVMDSEIQEFRVVNLTNVAICVLMLKGEKVRAEAWKGE
jgi:hypothetical protein